MGEAGLIFAFSFSLCFCLVATFSLLLLSCLLFVVVCFGFSLANCFKILYVLRFYLYEKYEEERGSGRKRKLARVCKEEH